ncbi:MAG: hypothetical protein GXO77_16690 [Calditrichaeota bacterium]|nr:hypothetical protein [Calditrichota bacterium]
MENVVAREIKSIEQMPGFTNISGFSSFIGYLETDTNKTYLSKWKKAAARKKRLRLIAVGASVSVFIILYLYRQNLLLEAMLSLALFSIVSAFILFAANREKKARADYFDDRRDYGIKIADFVSSLLQANYHSFFNGELFIYSGDFCSLIWVDNGNMVTYQKKNIKEVNLERVNIKNKKKPLSKTVFGVAENVSLKIKDDYEWRLDIFGNLQEYPKITLIFREDEQDIAKRLKTILKPKKK